MSLAISLCLVRLRRVPFQAFPKSRTECEETVHILSGATVTDLCGLIRTLSSVFLLTKPVAVYLVDINSNEISHSSDERAISLST